MVRIGGLSLMCIAPCCLFALYCSTMFWSSQNDRRNTQSFGLQLRGISSADDASDPCQGNEQILQIVADSGFILDATARDLICTTMPPWKEVTRLYGDKPRILGLETCAAYRAKIQKAKAIPMPRVAGLQNCGTTAFADTLFVNLKRDETIHAEHPRAYNVPWRKHTPWRYRYNITSEHYAWQEDKDLVLPIVIVREPYRWMQSMCKMPYRVKWAKSERHCPNLVPYPGSSSANGPPVNVSFGEVPPGEVVRYKSLVHLWSEWNREYLDADVPKLFIRYEDTLFHAEEVFRTIAECVGMEQAHSTFQRTVQSAKTERELSVDLLTALQKNGREKDRYGTMIAEDIQFAKKHLSSELMELFHYSHPNGVPFDSYAAEEWIQRQSQSLGK
ncbi:hypothetical protein MPSEU_000644400 [Mayamaea pseudoterrestris]|nr:hypothetical protein MPSEU_000644400 [Mayamaea pseudoterrestris]